MAHSHPAPRCSANTRTRTHRTISAPIPG
jgi:hypothetical protein